MILTFEKVFLRPLGSKMIFDNGRGRPKGEKTISWLIERTIWRHMGFKMTEHQFRHLAAKIILDEEPGAYPLLSQLLGHTSLKTAMRFYADLDTTRAARHHGMLLERAIQRHESTSVPPIRLRKRVSSSLNKANRGGGQ